MFKNLTNIGFVRTSKQAIGFYIVYFILAVLLGMLSGGISGVVRPSVSTDVAFQQGVLVGTITAFIFCTALAIVILSKKRQFTSTTIALTVVTAILSFIGGGLLGLIIPAYFTTLENKKTASQTTTSA